ncbi:NACHT and WD repeat domain-containing protein [Streptacidiphilus sp. N1-12]|uniref:NACHT and WD repeat domain-containing protein n=2 Tax=Streptacidiphilus alkalitolerans TaxID=3342712 RepID=A0ABV6V3H5_9ACTN
MAVTEYDDGSPSEQRKFSTGISAQVSIVEGWWADPSLDDRRRFVPARPKQLSDLRGLRDFLLDEELAEADDDEALVIYITGHGLAPANSPQHFLRLPDSYEDRPLSTAFPTAELIATVLDSQATHVLVMVDSCFSGRLETELKANLKALREGRRSLASLVVLAAGNDESRPRLGQFTNLLRAVHDHCADQANGYAGSHLSWQEWRGIVGAVFDARTMADVHEIWPTSSATVQKAHQQLSPCLPNPGYTAIDAVLGASLSEVGWTRTELDRYWISRAAGQPEADGPGWYFTGRTDLVKRVLEFLSGTEHVLVVTGEAGSGKSALLARVVTLSDARFRADPHYGPLIADIPQELDVPVGSVDAAVLARNSDPDELAQTLFEALDGSPSAFGAANGARSRTGSRRLARFLDEGPVKALCKLIGELTLSRGKPLTLVVDGVDEAKNPTRVITDLLRPLTQLRMDTAIDEGPAVRLLLGVRSPRESTTAPTPTAPAIDLLGLLIRATHAGPLIRTDEVEATRGDIAAYVHALLQAPQEGQGSAAEGHSELTELELAQLRHRRLAAAIAEEVSPSFLDARIAAEQLRSMPVMPDPEDPSWRRTLREGTEALLREDLGEVARWHETLPEHLMAVLRTTAFGQGAGLPWAEIWPAAVRALSSTPVSDPDAAIRLVMSSRLNGYLTTAVEDERTVYRPIHERISETLRLSPQLLLDLPDTGTAPAARFPEIPVTAAHALLVQAFGGILPEALDQPPHPYLRRHLIEHVAAAGLVDDKHVPWRFLPWETSGTVRAALGIPADFRTSAANLAAWARIEAFLGDAGTTARADSLRLSLLGTAVGRGAVGNLVATRPLLGYRSSVTPQWSQLRVSEDLLAKASMPLASLVSLTLPDGSPLVAAGDQGGEVRVWDPRTGTEFGLPFKPAPYVRALAVLTSPAQIPLLAVGAAHGVWIYDPQSGDATRLPETEAVFALAAFRTRNGRVRLAVGTEAGLITCDPFDEETAGLPLMPLDGVMGPSVKALATLRLPTGRTLLAAGGNNSTLQVFDAESLDTVTVVNGQGRGVVALALHFDHEDRPQLSAASSTTRSVRTYDAFTGEENTAARIRRAAASLAPYPRPGRGSLLALGGTDGGAVSLWDPTKGRELYTSPPDHTGRVKAVVAVDTGGQMPFVVSASLDRTVRIWNPAGPTLPMEPAPESLADGTLLAVIPGSDDGPSLLTPGRSGAISIRSAARGQLRGRRPRPQQLTWPDEWGCGVLTALATHVWPDGSASVVVGLQNGLIGHWDVLRGWRSLPVERRWQENRVRSLTMLPHPSADDVVLISGTTAGGIYFHALASGEQLWEPLHTNGSVRALAALPAKTGPLVAYSSDRTVRIGHLGASPHLRLPGRSGPIHSLAVCPAEDGSFLLATGGNDGCVRLWSPDNVRTEAYPVLEGHQGPVSSISVLPPTPTSPQPLLATTGSSDTTVRLWNPWTGEELMRIVTGTPLTSLCALPDASMPGTTDPAIAFGGPAGLAAVTVSR